MKKAIFRQLFELKHTIVFVLLLMSNLSAFSQETIFYFLGKGTTHRQTTSDTLALVANKPYRFSVVMYSPSPGLVQGATVRTPRNQVFSLVNETNVLTLDKRFATRALLDSVFTNGAYHVRTATARETNVTTLRVRRNNYPNTPYVVNWASAHDIDATANFMLDWIPLVGGDTNDVIMFELEDAAGNQLIGRGSEIDGTFDGTATGILIPANLLSPAQTYQAHLLFFRQTSLAVTGEVARVVGRGGFYRETIFTLRASPLPPPQGRLQFSSRLYEVNENEGSVNVTVTRTGGSAGSVSVQVFTSDGSALAEKDYVPKFQSLAFAEGVTSQTLNIPLIDDFKIEGNEQFYVSLGEAFGGAEVHEPTFAVVYINENEDAAVGTLRFSAPSYSATEGGGFAVLTVQRRFSAVGVLTVPYTVQGGTADPGADFAGEGGTLSFEDGQTTAEIRVPILNDVDFERPETFSVRLGNPSSGGSLQEPTEAPVTLYSDDLPAILGSYPVGGNLSLYGCRPTVERNASGTIEILAQSNATFRARTTLNVAGEGAFAQTYRGAVDANGRLSGTYAWQGGGDAGNGSFSGRFFINESGPGIRVFFNGASGTTACMHSGNLETTAQTTSSGLISVMNIGGGFNGLSVTISP